MQDHPEKAEADNGVDEPSHSPDGVDLTLIRWMLAMTPAERLQVLQSCIGSLLRLRHDEAGAGLPGHPSDPGETRG